jgi:hypothetical protein
LNGGGHTFLSHPEKRKRRRLPSTPLLQEKQKRFFPEPRLMCLSGTAHTFVFFFSIYCYKLQRFEQNNHVQGKMVKKGGSKAVSAASRIVGALSSPS